VATDRQDSADRHQKGISLYVFVYEKKIFSNFRFHRDGFISEEWQK